MTEREKAQLRIALDQMVQSFLAKLPERAEELDAYLEELRTGGSEIRASIEALAHSMAGSAGVFGFPVISHQAQLVERAIREGNDTATIVADIEKLLAMLEQPPARDAD